MLEKLTIVITTHNRHHLLEERVLPHFVEFGIHLMVVDSSPEPHQWSMSHPGVDYVHCPNEPLPHKLVKPVLERVKTPYMMMHADDTVSSQYGIEECLEFLEEHDDYSSARGLVFQCHYDNKERISTWDIDRYFMAVDGDKAEDRILQYFTLFSTNYYSVQRTECWHNIMRRLPEEMVNYYLADTYVAMMSAIHGKVAKLPVFFQATEAGPSINEKDLRYMCSPFKLATDSRYEVEVEATRKVLTNYLMEVSGLTDEIAKLYVDGGLALYWLQDKKVKSFGDRLRGEWQSFLKKTFFKKREKLRKQAKLEAAVDRERKDYARACQVLDEVCLADFKRLMKIVQTTYM